MVLLIVFVHEFGHLLMARIFKWNFDKIVIYPFGGCTKFDEKINRPLKEELLILLNGPFFQIILFMIVSYLQMRGFFTYRNYLIFKNYHYTLLVFNLLPIYPLDGGRLVNIFFNYFMPYKKGNKVVIFISFICIITCLIIYRNLNFSLMGILLFFEVVIYFKRQGFLYNRMLLERYMFSFPFKRIKIVNGKDFFYRDRRHVVLYDDKYITEKDYLKRRFDK